MLGFHLHRFKEPKSISCQMKLVKSFSGKVHTWPPGGSPFQADAFAGAIARLNEGDAFADEDGDDVDAELVDFACVQEGGDDFAAAPFFFLVVRRQFRRPRDRSKEERDFSLRRPTLSQERKGKKKSACSVRNDGHDGFEEGGHS